MKILRIAAPFFCIGLAAAQPKVALRLSDCIVQALERNPSIQVSQAKVRAAEAKSSEAGTALLPQVKFSGRAAELSSVPEFSLVLPPPIGTRTLFPSITESYLMRLTIQQPLFTGSRLSKNQEMAELNANAAQEDLGKDRSDLVLNVVTAYWNLYRANTMEVVLRQTVEQITEHLKNVKNLSQQGMATDADVMKVQVQLSDIKVKHIESKNSIRIASMVLNSLLGQSLELETVTADTPVVAQESMLAADLRSLEMKARERRPELKSMQLRREMNSSNVTAAKGGWYPQVYLAANYDYANPNQRVFPQEAKWNGTWDIGVTLQWNVWDWYATKHQTAQAEAALRQSEAGLIQMNDVVSLDVAQQYYSAQTAAEKVEVAVGGMEQAQESYRITSEKFKNGLASNADLLDAEIALLQAKLTHTQSSVEYTLAAARLKKAVGDPL